MDLLEVPFDAVVLRLISLPRAVLAGGSSWVWAVAVSAAAFVLWIRAFGSRLLGSTLSPPPPPPTIHSSSVDDSKAAPPPPLASDVVSVAHPRNRYLGEVSATKRRFKTYYYGSSIGVTGTEEDDGEVDEQSRTAPWEEDWRCDGLLGAERQRWDLGWYRCLDMAALDGSVVRLWDGGNGNPTAQKPSFYVN